MHSFLLIACCRRRAHSEERDLQTFTHTKQKIQTWSRLPCFRCYCLRPATALPHLPRLPLVPSRSVSDRAVLAAAPMRGLHQPHTSPQKSNRHRRFCRQRHPAECPCGQNRQPQLHRGFCRNEALLTSPHVRAQRNVCCPVSELMYMSAVDDLYTCTTEQPKEPHNVL